MRTNEDKVESIIELDPDIDVAPFIETANAIVTAVCAPLAYTTNNLELIERWLSAHFYAIRDMRAADESVGKGAAKIAYQYKVDLGFSVTMYGQQAMRVDYLGGLSKLEKDTQQGKSVQRIGISWLGNDCAKGPAYCLDSEGNV